MLRALGLVKDGLCRHGAILLLVAFVFVAFWQINYYPGETFPGWDHFWDDCITMNQIHTARRALVNVEIPANDPYCDFGANRAGDWLSIWRPPYLLSPFIPARPLAWLMKVMAVLGGGLGCYLLVRKFSGGDTFVSGFFFDEPLSSP